MHMSGAIKQPVVPANGERVIMSDVLAAVPADGEIVLPADTNNVTDLLDNLIADGKIPLTVAVFLTPGYPGPGDCLLYTSDAADD